MDTKVTTAFGDNAWKGQKRISERELSFDHDDAKASEKNMECNDIKRFCSAVPKLCSEKCFAKETSLSLKLSGHGSAVLMPPKKQILARSGLHFNAPLETASLSPITEISKNMNETSLSATDEEDKVSGKDTEKTYKVGDNTPLRSWNKLRNEYIKTHRFTRLLQNKSEDDVETTEIISAEPDFEEKEEPLDKLDDESSNNSDSGYQMPRKTANAMRPIGARRLDMNLSSSLHDDMMLDEISFYDGGDVDETQQQRSLNASPQLLGLLSPEGSPQRFHIIERSSADGVSPNFLSSRAAARRMEKGGGGGGRHQRSTILSSNHSTSATKSLRIFHSLSSGSTESTSMDDEYMELFEMESLESHSQIHINFPSDLNSLISGHIKHSNRSPACNNNNNSARSKTQLSNSSNSNSKHSHSSTNLIKTPEMRRPSVRRCLSMTENQPQTPKSHSELSLLKPSVAASAVTTPSSCFKRPEPPNSLSNSPVMSKRYRAGSSNDKENQMNPYCDASATPPSAAATTAVSARPPLRKYMSMNDADILSALARSDSSDQPDLIGDFSKPYVLPLMEGRHRDLKSVSSDTVARLLNGDFDAQVASYKIIDCRYPYEFEGGHIRGAKNLYTHEQIMEEFLTTVTQKTEQPAGDHKRHIIIFHCEFSSERGPKLSRFLRNNDRVRNTHLYPALDYPEIYLLHNGYKEFFATHAELCDPIAYRPMLEPAFSDAYRHFRAKSKSWNGDGLGGATSRLKKSRSRLLL